MIRWWAIAHTTNSTIMMMVVMMVVTITDDNDYGNNGDVDEDQQLAGVAVVGHCTHH